MWSADSAGQLWNLCFPKKLLNIVYAILSFVVRIKVSPFSNSASESSITRTLTESTHHIMDSAEKTELHPALSQQGILLGDLMDYGLDTRMGISSVALAEPISARTLCGTLLILYDYPTSNHAEEI